MARPAPLPVPADPPADRQALARALIERQLVMLTRLAEIGMDVAEAAGRRASHQAERDGPSADAPDPGLSFARAARAVRLTIALQSRLSQDLMALDRAESLTRAADASARRERAHRLVERAIEAGCEDEDEVERLSSHAWERLTDENDGELTDRPLGEVVARICEDLGLAPDWGGSALWPRPGPSWRGRAPAAGRVQGRHGEDERFQRRSVDLAAFADIDRASDIASEVGVEEPRGVVKQGALRVSSTLSL